MYVLFTDTDTDMTPEIAKKYGYHLISMPYSFGDEEIFPYESFSKFDEKEFYSKLRNGAMPKTSGLSPEKYRSYFEPFFKDGQDILYIHFSPNFSGTFSAMNLALDELKKEYPERKFFTLDTNAISLLSLNILLEAGQMYLDGKSAEEIVAWGEKEANNFSMYLTVEDLTFFKRSGRVDNFTAFFGNLLGIRPIIYISEQGKMESIDKARGENASLQKILDKVKASQSDIKKHKIILAHGDCPIIVEKMKALLIKEFGDGLDFEVLPVNPTAGCHCGPDAFGLSFHSNGRKK